MADIEITTLRSSGETLAQLSDLLIDVVADGGSVSFMHPLDRFAAEAYWIGALDTAVDGGAARLYQRLGYTLTGEIPGYAYKPHGGLTGTLIFWKRIGHMSLEVR